MKRVAWTGVVIGALAAVTGCSAAPPPVGGASVVKPSAVAKVTASSRTRKLSGVPTWQVYNGYGHVAALGFDKKGKPVDGLRIVYADAHGPVKGLRFETVKHRGVLALDEQGNVVENTLSYADLRTVYGGYRAIDAIAKKKASSGTAAAQAFRAFADDCDAWDYIGAAANCWKHGACVGTGIAAGVGGGPLAGLGAAGTCLRSIDVGSHIACGGSAAKVGQCLFDKLRGNVSNEDKADKKAEEKAEQEKAAAASLPNKEDDATKDPSSTEDPSKDPSACTDDNDPACATSQTPEDPSSCTDENDPACSSSADPQDPDTSCSADDTECSAQPPGEDDATAAEPTEEPDESTELDPNPDDPEETATEDAPPADEPEAAPEADPPAPAPSDTVEASFAGGVHLATFSPSTSKAVAKRVGGACRASHVLQCGIRKGRAYCRCVRA